MQGTRVWSLAWGGLTCWRAAKPVLPTRSLCTARRGRLAAGETQHSQTHLNRWKKHSKGLGGESWKGKAATGLDERWQCALHAHDSRQANNHHCSHWRATEGKATPLLTPELTLTSGWSLYKPDRVTLKASITLILYVQLLGLKLRGQHDRPRSLLVEGRVSLTAAPGQQRGLGEGLAAPPVTSSPRCTAAPLGCAPQWNMPPFPTKCLLQTRSQGHCWHPPLLTGAAASYPGQDDQPCTLRWVCIALSSRG